MPEHKSIHEALFAAQEELLALELKKDARNPHFKNSYITLDAALEEILPVLRNHDILLTQVPYETSTGDLGLGTNLTHVPSNTTLTGMFPLNKLQKDDPQGQGSAVTYARRYTLFALLALTADEDDDGNAARPAPKAKPKAKKKKADEPATDSGPEDESW